MGLSKKEEKSRKSRGMLMAKGANRVIVLPMLPVSKKCAKGIKKNNGYSRLQYVK